MAALTPLEAEQAMLESELQDLLLKNPLQATAVILAGGGAVEDPGITAIKQATNTSELSETLDFHLGDDVTMKDMSSYPGINPHKRRKGERTSPAAESSQEDHHHGSHENHGDIKVGCNDDASTRAEEGGCPSTLPSTHPSNLPLTPHQMWIEGETEEDRIRRFLEDNQKRQAKVIAQCTEEMMNRWPMSLRVRTQLLYFPLSRRFSHFIRVMAALEV